MIKGNLISERGLWVLMRINDPLAWVNNGKIEWNRRTKTHIKFDVSFEQRVVKMRSHNWDINDIKTVKFTPKHLNSSELKTKSRSLIDGLDSILTFKLPGKNRKSHKSRVHKSTKLKTVWNVIRAFNVNLSLETFSRTKQTRTIENPKRSRNICIYGKLRQSCKRRKQISSRFDKVLLFFEAKTCSIIWGNFIDFLLVFGLIDSRESWNWVNFIDL